MAAIDTRLDGVAASLGLKPPCRVSSTGNLTLSSTQVIDGVAVTTGDRVLVRAQTSTSENGIYEVRSSAWARVTDFNSTWDCARGTLVLVTTGTSLARPGLFYVSSTGINIPGSSFISFTQHSVHS